MNTLKLLLSLCTLFFYQPIYANIGGTDLHNFNPTSNGLDFVTVHSSDTLPSGLLNIGSFITYSTNSLPYFVVSGVGSNQQFAEPNDAVFASDIHIGLGIIEGWDIGISAVSILSQNIDDSTNLGTFEKTGLADIRFNTKVRLFKGEKSGLALIASVDKERLDNNPYTGTDPSLTVNAEVVLDAMLTSFWRWGLNFGYRFRDSGQAIFASRITPMPDQWTYSSALSYNWESIDSQLIFEIFGSYPTEEFSTPTDRELSNLQGLVGWKWMAHEKFDVHFGGGTELYHGLATPDILLYAGFNWRPGHLWGGQSDSDEDGVFDDDDKCPNTPEDQRSIVNELGCGDSDRDGVHNGIDQCPSTPPEHRTMVDSKGCYNTDLDGDGVLNQNDRCPGTPPGEKVNNLGCRISRMTEIRLENLNFVTGTATLVQSSRAAIDRAINQLAELQSQIQLLIVEGHTDSTGGSEMNQQLSEKRANTVRAYLLEKLKMDSTKVEAKGFGEEQPVAPNNTNTGRLKNRRVELRVIREQGGESVEVKPDTAKGG